jgi:hypothetical protein
MIKSKLAACLALALVGGSVLMGCSGAPADEQKPVQAGDGSQKPVAAGATGAGAAATGNAQQSGAAKPQ